MTYLRIGRVDQTSLYLFGFSDKCSYSDLQPVEGNKKLSEWLTLSATHLVYIIFSIDILNRVKRGEPSYCSSLNYRIYHTLVLLKIKLLRCQ